MAWVTVMLLVGSLLVGAGTWVYLKRRHGEGPAATSRPLGSVIGQDARNVKDLWEIRDVRQGVVLLDGYRYCLICRVSAIDFWLLSSNEQDAIEDAAAGALMQLSYPIQVYVTSQVVDTRNTVQELQQAAATLPDELVEPALTRADFLESMMADRLATSRQAFIVIPYATTKGFNHARGELMARLANLAEVLRPAGVKLDHLPSEADIDLFAHILNRRRRWSASRAIEAGALEAFYHISERQVRIDDSLVEEKGA